MCRSKDIHGSRCLSWWQSLMRLVRLPHQQLVGWPDRPEGRSGREATRDFIIRNPLHRTSPVRRPAKRSYLDQLKRHGAASCRFADPAGAAHAARPPDLLPAAEKRMRARRRLTRISTRPERLRRAVPTRTREDLPCLAERSFVPVPRASATCRCRRFRRCFRAESFPRHCWPAAA